MFAREWIDPRDVDWTDPLNALAKPGYTINNNPYVARAINDPYMLALRNAKGIEPRCYTCPDPIDQIIAPGATYDYEAPTEPNFWLWALNASGSSANFLFNVVDSVTGASLFSQPVYMRDFNALISGKAKRGPFYFLSTPHLYVPPSYPVVRIINTDTGSQTCRVNLFGAVEYDV